ncbi:MAG: hypothetical protein JXR27_11960 [Paludibacteraceae bacterium]|nr:hypothetical protein [Paludibacteraceae bacterium]
MKKTTLFIILIIFGITTQLTAQVNGTAAIPLASTPEKPVYYYIESAYNGSTGAKPATGISSNGMLLYSQTTDNSNANYALKESITNVDDVATWRLEASGANIKIINKNTWYLKTSVNPTLVTLGATAEENILSQYANTFQFSIKPTTGNPVIAWHNDARGNYLDKYSSQGANSRTAWYFIVVPGYEDNYNDYYASYQVTLLGNQITAATSLLTNTVEGTEIFNYSAASRNNLQSAIDAAQAVYDNSTTSTQQAIDAIAALNLGIYNYKSSQVMPFNVSDETNTYWYQIHDKRSPAVYWNIATVGTTANALGRTTSSNPTANTQLFKFVKAPYPNTGYYIYSKSDATNALSSPTTNNGEIIRIDSTPISWLFENAQTDHYLISTETSLRQLNSYTDKISYYNGGAADDGNNWMFIELDLTVLKDAYNQKRTEARELYTNTASYEGSDFGQFSAANRSTLDGVVSAEEAKDVETLSFNQLEENISTLQSAIDNFKSSVNKNINSLLSANPENYRWYSIRSTGTATYVSGKVISSTGRVLSNKFTFEVPGEPVTDTQLFRFEISDNQVKIRNKANSYYMAADGAISETAASFALDQLTDGYSFNIKPASANAIHAQEAGSHIVNWPGIAGSASAWVFDYVTETAKPVSRTISVSSADTNKGTAAIVGSTESTTTTAENITVKAIPLPGFIFSKWTDAVTDADVSSEPFFTYTGTTDIQLKANFATLGTVGRPLTTDDIMPVYYYIQSASDGSYVFNGYSGDFRNNVMISPTTAGNIIHNKLSAATSNDHALWQIVNVEGVTMLKNKATGWFMNGSRAVGTTGSAFTSTTLEAAPTQYVMKTADQPSYINTWKNNLCDRLSLVTTANSMLAWYFVVEPGSLTNYNFTTGNVNTPNVKYIIRTANKVITVDGVENFEVFSINGQKQNKTQALESGIYIVRIQNQAFKVNVK